MTNQIKSKPGRRVAGPFWAQAVNQKRQYLQIRIYKSLHFRPCRSCKKSQKVPTMLFCPVRIPSNAQGVCSDRKLWLFDPKCALADLAVELWWPDSTPTCDVPSGVRAIAPHSKTGPNVAYTRFLTMVLSQLQMPNLEPEYSTGEECRAIPTTNLYLKAVPRQNGIVSEMKHQVSKGYLCKWCGGHWAKCEFHTKSSYSLHDPRFAYLQYAWSLDSQVCRGRPTRRVPKGCHDSKRWTHRCAGKAATCLAKFQ